MEELKDMVEISSDEDRLIARLSGEIDHHAARPIREEIDSALYRMHPNELCLDFTLVRFMDSSGIALIIGRAELARDMGCRVAVRGLSRTQEKLVKLSGVERLPGVTVEKMEVKK